MIIVTKPDTTEEQLQHIVERIGEWGLKTQISRGAVRTVVGGIGPEDAFREKQTPPLAWVESVPPVLKPYRLVAREFRDGNPSVVRIGDVPIGDRQLIV